MTEKRKSPDLVQERKAPVTGIPTSGLGVLVGYPKGGKSMLAASFPGAYVIELEPAGGDRLDGRFHEIDNIEDVRLLIPKLIKAPDVETIVIDTIDAFATWMENEIAAEAGLQCLSDRKEGVNTFELWGKFKLRMENFTAYMKRCGKLVLLIAHTRDAKTDGDGRIISPAGINVPGKAGGFIAAQADFIGFVSKKEAGSGIVYTVSFKGGPLGQWGSRVKEINGKTIVTTEANGKTPYDAFAAMFNTNGKAKTAPPEVKKPAPSNGKKKAPGKKKKTKSKR